MVGSGWRPPRRASVMRTLAHPPGGEGDGGPAPGRAGGMVENAIGTFSLPPGAAANFRISGGEPSAPVVAEAPPPSVTAAASKAAKAAGGFEAVMSAPHCMGQVQLLDVGGTGAAAGRMGAAAPEILRPADSKSATPPEDGRGAGRGEGGGEEGKAAGRGGA